MAIVDKKTNYYYRIDFDECYIKGDKIIPNFEIYKSEGERLKEKARAGAINDALLKMQTQSDAYYAQMMEIMKKYDLSDISHYVEEDGYTLKKELFPEAYMLQQKHLELKDLYQVLLRPYYFKRTETFNGTIKEFSSREYELMSQYGIDKNWLTDYVVIIDKPSTTVGTYQAGETISTEYYYNKLKPKMINEYKDC